VFSKRGLNPPPLIHGINRVESIKILGVIIDKHINFIEHVNSTVTKCAQALFALRLMRQYGMPTESLQLVFSATLMSKILYASPSWCGFINQDTINRIDSFIRRAKKFGYCDESYPEIELMFQKADNNFFKKIVSDAGHVLFPLLPPKRNVKYALRTRPHSFTLPRKDDNNFVNRMLFTNMY
jgi:hypothetical protein